MIQTHRRKYIANLKEYLNKKQFFSRIGIYLAVGRFVATSFRKGPVLYEELSSRNIWTTGGIHISPCVPQSKYSSLTM